MDQLTYDLQLPEEGYDVAEVFADLISEIAEAVFIQQWDAADEAATDHPLFNESDIYGWLRNEELGESDRMRTMAQDILNGANLRLHAMDCATNYVEYLLSE